MEQLVIFVNGKKKTSADDGESLRAGLASGSASPDGAYFSGSRRLRSCVSGP